MSLVVPPVSFRNSFARTFRVDPESFEREVFIRCVPPGYRLIASVLIRWVPYWFTLDLQVLGEVARATTLEEVRVLSGDFRAGIRHRPNLVRDRLGLRVSGRRLMTLAKQALSERQT